MKSHRSIHNPSAGAPCADLDRVYHAQAPKQVLPRLKELIQTGTFTQSAAAEGRAEQQTSQARLFFTAEQRVPELDDAVTIIKVSFVTPPSSCLPSSSQPCCKPPSAFCTVSSGIKCSNGHSSGEDFSMLKSTVNDSEFCNADRTTAGAAGRYRGSAGLLCQADLSAAGAGPRPAHAGCCQTPGELQLSWQHPGQHSTPCKS